MVTYVTNGAKFMAAVKKIAKESVVAAALEIIRDGGVSALNARALAARLGCSTRPIYLAFGSMEKVTEAAHGRIFGVYQGYLSAEVNSGRYPVYKAYGMAYIRFARQEREFFKHLFMRDRTRESGVDDDISDVIAAVMKSTGLDEERAKLFHLESWIFVHGIAVMSATSYIDFDEKLISEMLTDVFEGLKARFGAN